MTGKIQFSETIQYDGGGHENEARTFEAGKVYELPIHSADRWVRRGKAKFVTAEEAAAVAKAVSEPPKDKAIKSPKNAEKVETK